MFSRLFILLVLVPFTELFLIFKVHGIVERHVGAFDALIFTFGSIIVTGMVGAWLAKREGLSVFQRLQEKAARGEQPTNEMIEGIMILIGGIMLLTPGYLTDMAGLSLVFPLTRVFYRKAILSGIAKAMESGNIHFYSNFGQNGGGSHYTVYNQTMFSSNPQERTQRKDPDVIDITDYTDHSNT